MATFVTYSLLILDVLVIALLIQLIIFVPVWLVRRRRRTKAGPVRRGGATPREARPEVSSPSTGFGVGARKRRCDDCRSGWVGEPGSDASVLALRMRRAARRRAKREGRPVPEWAGRRGWDRCPSCFSTNVRDSRKQSQVGAR
jgi:hypothetical protein